MLPGLAKLSVVKSLIIIRNEDAMEKTPPEEAKTLILSCVLNIHVVDPDLIAWNNKQLSAEEQRFSELTVSKCGGLPKVIIDIGDYAANEIAKIGRPPGQHSLATISRDIHDDFMSKLETHSRFHRLRGMFSWMHSYFNECSDPLKPCIFYLSVFPTEHKNIRQRRLLRRWIAEGYSRDTCGSTAEENAEMLFAELVGLSIIQKKPPATVISIDSSKSVRCQVNGFFYEYVMSRPMEDNLVFALEGRCGHNSQRAGAGQHLTIRSSWDGDEIVFKSMDLSRLRSLTVFGKWRSFFISKETNMRFLRVLDLENTTSGFTDGVLEQIGTLLPRLKFLSLRGCKEITRIPDTLGGLRPLQTLDVRNTNITTLPHAIMKLVKLQYIRAGTSRLVVPEGEGDGRNPEVATPLAEGDGGSTSQLAVGVEGDDARTHPGAAGEYRRLSTVATWSNRARGFASCSWLSAKLCGHLSVGDVKVKLWGVKVPAVGIGNLTILHTLGVVSVRGAGGKAILAELNKLTQLRKLGVSGIDQENWKELCSVVSGHGYLESLSVRLDEQHEKKERCRFVFSFGGVDKAPETLKNLKLYGRSMHLSMASIKNLRNLRTFHLEVSALTLSKQDIYNVWGLKKHDVVVMAVVQVLSIDCSDGPDSVPRDRLGLEMLPDLKEVWLKGSYSVATKQHWQALVASHPKKPVFKLEEQLSSS